MLEWNRLMQTCVNRKGSDILLIAGMRPFLRIPKLGLSEFQVAPITAEEIATLLSELSKWQKEKRKDGLSQFDVPFQKPTWFRVVSFGGANPQMAIAMLMKAPMKATLR